jgi:hypothetical protein
LPGCRDFGIVSDFLTDVVQKFEIRSTKYSKLRLAASAVWDVVFSLVSDFDFGFSGNRHSPIRLQFHMHLLDSSPIFLDLGDHEPFLMRTAPPIGCKPRVVIELNLCDQA